MLAFSSFDTKSGNSTTKPDSGVSLITGGRNDKTNDEKAGLIGKMLVGQGSNNITEVDSLLSSAVDIGLTNDFDMQRAIADLKVTRNRLSDIAAKQYAGIAVDPKTGEVKQEKVDYSSLTKDQISIKIDKHFSSEMASKVKSIQSDEVQKLLLESAGDKKVTNLKEVEELRDTNTYKQGYEKLSDDGKEKVDGFFANLWNSVKNFFSGK